jgi:DNA-binding winged helix-turn-helix (wHTH) protein
MSKLHISALVSFATTFLFAILYFNAWYTGADTQPDADKTNLALRQTAHQLYKMSEDHYSTIPPVQKKAPNRYQLKLNRPLDYDYLPYLLDEAFTDFKINHDYTVAIRSCSSDDILLGYNLSAFKNKEISCVGRELSIDCHILEVAFEMPDRSMSNIYLSLITGSFLISLFLALIALRSQPISNAETISAKGNIQIGHFNFIPDKLSLEIDQQYKTLTFREAKLLRYLATHANEILKREDIQQHVWQEEGVIVGRSLDVFISRLRKALKPDPNVVIKNIHGIGYRLETKQNTRDN